MAGFAGETPLVGCRINDPVGAVGGMRFTGPPEAGAPEGAFVRTQDVVGALEAGLSLVDLPGEVGRAGELEASVGQFRGDLGGGRGRAVPAVPSRQR